VGQVSEGGGEYDIWEGGYQEAMDVYLICLVAIYQNSLVSCDENLKKGTPFEGSSEPEEDEDEELKIQTENEIKLPVLLNLALSALTTLISFQANNP